MNHKDLSDIQLANVLIHVTVNSFIFGFIDDMYMTVTPFYYNKEVMLELKIMSQLRDGEGDFLQNYYHIKSILNCLNKEYDNYDMIPRPCSTD